MTLEQLWRFPLGSGRGQMVPPSVVQVQRPLERPLSEYGVQVPDAQTTPHCPQLLAVLSGVHELPQHTDEGELVLQSL